MCGRREIPVMCFFVSTNVFKIHLITFFVANRKVNVAHLVIVLLFPFICSSGCTIRLWMKTKRHVKRHVNWAWTTRRLPAKDVVGNN